MASFEEYIRARRMGLKAFQASMDKGESTYIPALEEIAEETGALPKRQLGLMEIPLLRVRGTGTKGRMNAFASNFMPILEPNSEFATKWMRLYESVAENGLRNPVTVLEYMNQYYVIEGNKRVSVMKYLDAMFIEAEVTRILPRRTDEPENRLYFRYLEFNEATGINYIWFSREDSYAKLYELTGHAPGERWSEDEIDDLRASYMRFRTEYKRLFNGAPPMPTADAFLVYMRVYGYEGASDKLPARISEELRPLRGEFEHGDGTVDLVMDPMAQKNGNILTALFRPAKVKSAFLYHHSPRASGWHYWHDLGRVNVENALGDKLESAVGVVDDPARFEEEMERLIAEGSRVVFATSPLMLQAAIRVSLAHPDVKVLNCSLLAPYYHVRSYYLRLYEAKFLIGMIAGALTENDRIGYIADYPILGAPSSINAFALGARMVNPRAVVELEWSTRADFDPEDPFRGRDVRLISNRDIRAPKYTSKEYGLYSVADGEVRNLAIPLLDWSKFYEAILRSVLAGTFDSEGSGVGPTDYWWGMSADALDVILSTHFDPYLARMIHFVKSQLQSGQLWPFEGELRSQDGTLRCEADSQLSPAQILTMDWLLDNVSGSFPRTDELRENARPIVEMQGVLAQSKPDAASFRW